MAAVGEPVAMTAKLHRLVLREVGRTEPLVITGAIAVVLLRSRATGCWCCPNCWLPRC